MIFVFLHHMTGRADQTMQNALQGGSRGFLWPTAGAVETMQTVTKSCGNHCLLYGNRGIHWIRMNNIENQSPNGKWLSVFVSMLLGNMDGTNLLIFKVFFSKGIKNEWPYFVCMWPNINVQSGNSLSFWWEIFAFLCNLSQWTRFRISNFKKLIQLNLVSWKYLTFQNY